ncbi:hypothetical protein KJZ71_00390 [Patescibacteria group bacterium]|nr:hypothetical protein [Patescibacteria group bacterium]MDL1953147.1 hypothetical protein [Candidatus Uhrbacteria bacterium UHB]RIL00397.1 MAG: hypothetical protein DCC77_02420 [Candidatus Uhrbacteria bacterium]
MRYSVCIIDNDIPAAGTQAQASGIKDSELLNASNLQLLLNQETWTDEVIKNLTQTLLDQKDTDGISPKWEVFAFTNPSFYINTIDNGFFRSDLVVFDWEYPGAQAGSGTDSESILKEILDRTFCLVFIFSKADKKAEIEAILAKPEFQQYKERLEYLDKTVGGVDQTNTLLQKAEQMYANNFSFKFASTLRKKAVQSADKILSDMGKASLNDVKNHIVVGDGGKKDFVDFLTERFRTSLAGKEIYDLVDEIPEPAAGTPAPDESLAAKVWSYRLYFHQQTGDEMVRRGDIVKINGNYALVLSADCDLGYFWKKNLGIINTVALHEIDQTNSTLKDWLTLCVKPNKIPGKISSLLGRIGELSEGPFVLPFVPLNGGTKNFIAVPKDLVSTRITLPSGWSSFTDRQKKEDPMKYSYWSGAERLCTISEPFLTPVIQHVLNTMGGNGVPDYPEHMKDILKKVLDDFTAAGAVASKPATSSTPTAV